MKSIPLQSLRLVVLALAAGTLLISGVFAFLRVSASAPENEVGPLLGYLVPVLALANCAVYALLRRGLLVRARPHRAQHREALRAGGVPRELAQLTLIGCALAESVGLFGAMAWFLGGASLLLAAPALALVAILAQFPSVERFEAWLRD
ncbi:MAG: hypothetical protein ABL998_04785 [Planctomycetota bacterium]